jgi:copper oxidase (laccase) domain-containing protein
MALSNVFEPTAIHQIGPVSVATFDGKKAPLENSRKFASRHESEITTVVTPPGDATQAGFQEIQIDPQKYEISCDAVLVTKKQAVAIRSRDCPIVVIVDTEKLEWVICHAGRPAISPLPITHIEHSHGIINEAVKLLLSRGSQTHHLQAYVTAGICKKCFVHHPVRDANLLNPFTAQFSWAFDDTTGWFDIKRIIVSQLMNMRISGKNIHQDGLCTKEHPGLASKRGGDGPDKNNLVLVFCEP